MLKTLRKLGLYGIGLAILTEEKIEEIVKDAVSEGKIKKEESKKAIDDLLKESKKEKNKLNLGIKKEVKKVLTDLDVPSKKDMSALEARINSLEETLLKELKQKR